METLREIENEKENIFKVFSQRSGKILKKLLTGNVSKFKILRAVVNRRTCTICTQTKTHPE